jgi:hypothetical protein
MITSSSVITHVMYFLNAGGSNFIYLKRFALFGAGKP